MKRIESEAFLASYHTTSSFKNRVIHDYTPLEEAEPLYDIALVEESVRNMKKSLLERNDKSDMSNKNDKKFGKSGFLVYRKGKKNIDLSSYNEHILTFGSGFESGNLQSATKIGENEYNLQLSTDLGTDSWVQWFYFSIKGMKKGITYKFNIINFYKVDSLFNYGLKPLLYIEGKGWRRAGENIAYFENTTFDESSESHRFTTTWTYTPDMDIDIAYWAHSYPYTYSDLQDYLADIDSKNLPFVERDILCYSLAHNRLDLLTITNPTESELEMKAKQGVIISSRVHPGESVASWMMKGAIDFLLSNDPDAIYLRDHYVFKIVPMLNPDGVILGNYRCSLAGEDLNRVWLDTDALTFPEIYGYKKFIQEFSEERNVILFVDFHGHSKKKDAFFFGNTSKNRTLRLYTRIFPLLISKHSNGNINFNFCTFSMEKFKRSTARVVAFKDLKLQNSFTLEASMCGPSSEDVHYNVVDYESIGASVCKGLIKYEDKGYVQKLFRELNQMYHQREKKAKPVKKDSSILIEAKNSGIKSQKGKALTETQKIIFKEGNKFVAFIFIIPILIMFIYGFIYGF